MTVDVSAPQQSGPWTPRVALSLAVLAAAAFVYVTAEIMPVGALPAIAADLNVSEAMVGTLLASYALVAALATVPLVRLTATWPRRRTLIFTLVSLTVSQLISALAPTFAVLVLGRVLCALTHGLMWSVIAPIGARLVPATHAARATMAVYVGTGLALVVGSPLTAVLSELWGWRLAVIAITGAAAAVLVAARLTLPLMAAPSPDAAAAAGSIWHHHNRKLVTMCVLTLVGVTGHFISYTFIVVIIAGRRAPAPSWRAISPLAGYASVRTTRPARTATTTATCRSGTSPSAPSATPKTSPAPAALTATKSWPLARCCCCATCTTTARRPRAGPACDGGASARCSCSARRTSPAI
jgi:predicted MFS family arabinose efflux permease